MARVDDEFLDEDAVVAERRLRFRTRKAETFRAFGVVPGDPHALAATAGGGLDHDRITDLLGDRDGVLGIRDFPQMAGDGGNLRCGGCLLGFDLVAHGRDGAGIGADEDDAVFGQRLGEGFAFGQEAVAGVDCLRAGLLAGLDDAVHQQIGLGGRRRADVDGFVGHFHMQGVAVGIGVYGCGGDAHAACRLDDPAGNFATVGNQDFLEHRRSWSCLREMLVGRGLLRSSPDGGHPGQTAARRNWNRSSKRCRVGGKPAVMATNGLSRGADVGIPVNHALANQIDRGAQLIQPVGKVQRNRY